MSLSTPAPDPAGPTGLPTSLPITHEARFAIVLYGGVSLAIYMHGISQELLRMVRGGSDIPERDLDEVERIYRKLSCAVPMPDPESLASGKSADKATNGAGRCRFVVDIISGTSAGGINGVALAKALVGGNRDLSVLHSAWTKKASIGELLNDQGAPTRQIESLLDGAKMFDLLQDTLARMSAEPKGEPLVEGVLDLFVTATDLVGRELPIQLTGMTIREPVHKSVFHFAYDDRRNDFGAKYDAMLAFAARCTSSFPVAFPPMRYDDIPPVSQDTAFSRFFAEGKGFGRRAYADGGYLDNRPFSHVIGLIPLRTSSLPNERKLLFIDPFPDKISSEKSAVSQVHANISFLNNAQLAATTLPRKETIRDDMRAVIEINRRLDRLSSLQERLQTDRRELGDNYAERHDDLEKMGLKELVNSDCKAYGRCYPFYHHLRVYNATDQLSAFVAQLGGYDLQSDEYTYLRQFIRAWRNNWFQAYTPFKNRAESENAFLSRYDIGFRQRRLVHLRSEIDKGLAAPQCNRPVLTELRDIIEAELTQLRHLANPLVAERKEWVPNDLTTALEKNLRENFEPIMRIPGFKARFRKVEKVYKACPEPVDAALKNIGERFSKQFQDSTDRIKAALTAPQTHGLGLWDAYRQFHWHDVETFPFLEGTQAEEHSELQVFRISPADSSLNPDPGKLMGINLHAFGGFLSEEWREHDILWGRLDGAERIVAALLPGAAETTRQDFVQQLHTAILQQEFGPHARNGRQLALLKAKLRDQNLGDEPMEQVAAAALGVTNPLPMGQERFKEHYTKAKPVNPATQELTAWGGRAATILSRMVNDLPLDGLPGQASRRLARLLKFASILGINAVRFAMPSSYRGMLAQRAAFVVMLAGLLLWIAGIFFSGEMAWTGLVIVLLAAVAWAVLYWVGQFLQRGPGQQRRASLRQLGRIAAMALVVVLAVLGAISVYNIIRDSATAWRSTEQHRAARMAGAEGPMPAKVEV